MDRGEFFASRRGHGNINRTLGGSHIRSGCFRDKNYLLPPQESDLHFSGAYPAVWSLFISLAGLWNLIIYSKVFKQLKATQYTNPESWLLKINSENQIRRNQNFSTSTYGYTDKETKSHTNKESHKEPHKQRVTQTKSHTNKEPHKHGEANCRVQQFAKLPKAGN
jgi:hypothetical protein